MRPTALLLFLLLTAPPAAAAAAPPQEEPASLDEAEFRLLRYEPHYTSPTELAQTLEALYGRALRFPDRVVKNLVLMGDCLVIYETSERMGRIQEALHRLDAESTAEEATGPQPEMLVLETYRPRFLAAEAVLSALLPFRANVQDWQAGYPVEVQNITLVPGNGTILVRDVPERAARIREAIERIDQPVPQVLLIFQVLRGVDHEPDPPAPAALQAQLRELLPWAGYELEATGMLRLGAAPGAKVELEMESAREGGGNYRVELRSGAWDGQRGALALEDCRFAAHPADGPSRALFQTSTTVFQGEQSVLGVSGAEPVFLVLELREASSAH